MRASPGQTGRHIHTLYRPFPGTFLTGGAVFTKALKLLSKMVPPLLKGAQGGWAVGLGDTDMGSHEPKELGGSDVGGILPLYSLFPPWSSQDPGNTISHTLSSLNSLQTPRTTGQTLHAFTIIYPEPCSGAPRQKCPHSITRFPFSRSLTALPAALLGPVHVGSPSRPGRCPALRCRSGLVWTDQGLFQRCSFFSLPEGYRPPRQAFTSLEATKAAPESGSPHRGQ